MEKKIAGILILFCRSFAVNVGVNMIFMQVSIFCVGKQAQTSVGLMPHDVNNGTQLLNGAGYHFQDEQTLVEGKGRKRLDENMEVVLDEPLESTHRGVVLGMVVPIKRNSEIQIWKFLQPFTPVMWCTTVAFTMHTAIVVWLLEHKIDPPANGVTSVKEAMAFILFSMFRMSFTQRESVESNLARIVIAVWLVVMFIIGSTYTSTFSSILVASAMKPSITSVKGLLDKNLSVGYREGSYIGNYVHKNFHIREENLKVLKTPEEYAVALSKGPEKGGVAAIFDEIQYIRIFLSGRHGYTMVEPTYMSSWGFDTGFPKGSPPVEDICSSVACIISNFEANPKSLGVQNFVGLFLIMGTTSTLALIIFFCNALYNYVFPSWP